MHKIRFVDPVKVYQMVKDELDAAYFKVMEKGDLIDRGQLKSFEDNLAKFVGTKYAVGLNSGYDALHISLRAAGIGPGDEVIVPAHTFVATCSAVVNVGAKPVLVDVGKDFNIDCDKIEEAIRNQKSEVRNRRSEVRDQRSEGRGRRAEGRGQRAEDRGQRSEGRGQRSGGRGQRTEVRGQRTEDRRRKAPHASRFTPHEKWRAPGD